MLGCFHTLMNLLGAIGTVMEATGLKNILETVYGENAVVHMMTGKAVQRALLGHLLVDKCLSSQLITEMAKDDPEIQTLLEQAEKLYSFRLSGETTLGDADRSTNLSTWPLDCACVGLDVFVFIPHSWANSRLLKGMLSLTISSGVPCREQLLFLCSGSWTHSALTRMGSTIKTGTVLNDETSETERYVRLWSNWGRGCPISSRIALIYHAVIYIKARRAI